jgi:hypothetical protein
MAKISEIVTPIPIAIALPNFASRSCSGEVTSPASAIPFEIFPISDRSPIPTTTPCARPLRTVVPANAMLFLSPSDVLSGSGPPPLFADGSGSPVSIDSSIPSSVAAMILRSAGTLTPLSSMTISPTTSSSAGRRHCSPARMARACGAVRLLTALSRSPARCS